jgi:hypothetical protein
MSITAFQGKHGRVFLRTAVSFGTAMGVMQAVQGHLLFAVVVAPVAGALFGGSMVWLSVRAERRLQQRGFTTDSLDPTQGREWKTRQSVAATFDACRAALQEVRKVRVARADTTMHRIEAKVGMTWQSFGERMIVEVSESSDGVTVVRVRSEPRMQRTAADSGKGVENVETFGRALQKRVPDAQLKSSAIVQKA